MPYRMPMPYACAMRSFTLPGGERGASGEDTLLSKHDARATRRSQQKRERTAVADAGEERALREDGGGGPRRGDRGGGGLRDLAGRERDDRVAEIDRGGIVVGDLHLDLFIGRSRAGASILAETPRSGRISHSNGSL